MTATTYPASPAQISFINDLCAKRDVPATLKATINQDFAEHVTSRQASAYIDLLKTLPYKKADGPSPMDAYREAIAAVEPSKYAIPGGYLAVLAPDLVKDRDHLFLEVKNYKGKRYLNRLHGAPGDFTRSRLPLEVAVRLLKFIANRHVEFAQEFGRVYAVCGRCAAPLTDAKSREVHIGPECRKVWGL